MQYFGARYLSNGLARFNSIDPVLLSFQDSDKFKAQAGRDIAAFLTNPQELNSYVYTANNPLRYVDPDGNTLWQVITGQQSLSNYRIEIGQAAEILHQTSPVWKTVLDHPIASSAAIGVGGALAASGIAAGATWGLMELGVIGASQVPNVAQKATDYTQRYGQDIGQKMNRAAEAFGREGIDASEHAIFRTATREIRGVTPEKVIDTLRQGEKYYDTAYKNLNYFKDGIRLAVDEAGKIITVVTQKTIENSDRFIRWLNK